MKPRPVAWEQLVLDGGSPLRRALDEAARDLGPDGFFGFLPDLSFYPWPREEGEDGEEGVEGEEGAAWANDGRFGGEVEHIDLEPLGRVEETEAEELARIVGRSLAFWSWLGVSDLHWENLALGRSEGGSIVFTPLDVESIFDDLSRPTETKLLPDADPEVADVCRHACGVRRVLPFLGKPVHARHVAAMAADYSTTLDLLDRRAGRLAEAITSVPGLRETPIRVCLRGTDVYVRAMRGSEEEVWPPFLAAEEEQMARGDVPYFFRRFGRPGIFYYSDAALESVGSLPTEGDVPQLEPLLDPWDGLRSPNREILRTEGLFTILGAFDHPSFAGRVRAGEGEGDELEIEFGEIEFGEGVLAVETAEEVLETDRDLSHVVGSVYSPCRCGEVESVLVPSTTVCEG